MSDSYADIRQFDGKLYRRKIDVLTGGFPCQPFSTAGQRRGTADDRYLWPEMLRVIGEVQPRWVVGENVYGLITWNDGLVFRQVLSDLEAQGYEVTRYVSPASGVNSPHQRNRVWFVACNAAFGRKETDTDTSGIGRQIGKPGRYASEERNTGEHFNTDRLCPSQLAPACANAGSDGCHQCNCKDEKQPGKKRQYALCHSFQMGSHAAYSNSPRLEGRTKPFRPAESGPQTDKQPARLHQFGSWQNWPTQSPLCGRDDGLPDRLDRITLPKWRTQSIKMYGNAIVPQVAIQLFKAIIEFEKQYAA